MPHSPSCRTSMTTSCGPPSASSASWSTRCRSSDASCTRSSTAWRPTWPPGTKWAERDRRPRMTPDLDSRLHDLGEFIRDQRRTARLSLRKLSELAGISKERDTEADLVADILRDRTITEGQKQALLEIYRSFQREQTEGEGTAQA